MPLVCRQINLAFVKSSEVFKKNSALKPPFEDIEADGYPISVFGECEGNPKPWTFTISSYSDEGDANTDPTELDFECNFQIASNIAPYNAVMDDGDGFKIRLDGQWHDEDVEGPEDFLDALHKAFPELSDAQCVILRDWSECPDDQEMLEETYSDYASGLSGGDPEVVSEFTEGEYEAVISADTYDAINPESLLLCDVHYSYQDPADDEEYEIASVLAGDEHPGFDDSGYEQFHRIFWFAAK